MIAQTIKTPKERQYVIRFTDGATTKVYAETISKPSKSVGSTECKFYVFENEGVVVAEYRESDVSGWQVIQ